jgi:hypothetical protein
MVMYVKTVLKGKPKRIEVLRRASFVDERQPGTTDHYEWSAGNTIAVGYLYKHGCVSRFNGRLIATAKGRELLAQIDAAPAPLYDPANIPDYRGKPPRGSRLKDEAHLRPILPSERPGRREGK